MIKKIVLTILVLLLLAGLAAGGLFYMEYSRKTEEGTEIEVEIPEGSATQSIAALLKEKGVIRFQIPFLVKVSQSEYRGKIRYGTFLLNDGMSLDDLIKELATGGISTKDSITLMIPEGYTVEMIAKRIEDQGIMSAEVFLNALKNAASDFTDYGELPSDEGVRYQLQGFLFPDTYYIDEDMTADDLVKMFLDEFRKKFDEKHMEDAKALGMSVAEVITRASLLEKETTCPEEYPMIAGVINNRLAKNMRLQFDSTVVYAVSEGQFGVERVLYDHLKVDSPYNTYKVDGLPIGPICNPGMEAIDATLHPAEHPYLFFQTDTVKNDGTSLFFETYEEHEAAAATATKAGETKNSSENTETKTDSETNERE